MQYFLHLLRYAVVIFVGMQGVFVLKAVSDKPNEYASTSLPVMSSLGLTIIGCSILTLVILFAIDSAVARISAQRSSIQQTNASQEVPQAPSES